MGNFTHVLSAIAFAAGLSGASQSLDIPVSSGGSTSTRHLNFFAPSGLNKPALVILMHGAQGNGNNLAEGLGWDSVAMREKFVVATPSSNGSFWDLGGNSDVDFVMAVIDTMARRFDIDRNKVYASGWSMGGMMSYYLACHKPEKIAAIGPSSGYLIYGQSGCSEARNVPIYHIHGIWDDFVKYSDLHSYLSNNWIGAFGCPTTPDSSKPALGATQLESWEPCEKNGKKSEIHLESYWKAHGIDKEESEVFWNFLKRFSLNAPALPAVGLYQKTNSHGLLTRLVEGSYSHARLAKVGLPDSSVLSLKVDAGLTVELFDNDNFQNPIESYSKDASDLSAIKNKIRAIRVSSKPPAPGATFYQYANYGGLSATLPEGSYTLSQLQAAGIPDNAASSIKVDAGLTVELFDGDHFTIPLGSFGASVEDLASVSAAGKVTSLRISKGGTTGVIGTTRGAKAALRFDGGVLTASGLKDGSLQVLDMQGRARRVSLIDGVARLGMMPAGVYHVLLDGSGTRMGFVVLPGK